MTASSVPLTVALSAFTMWTTSPSRRRLATCVARRPAAASVASNAGHSVVLPGLLLEVLDEDAEARIRLGHEAHTSDSVDIALPRQGRERRWRFPFMNPFGERDGRAEGSEQRAMRRAPAPCPLSSALPSQG